MSNPTGMQRATGNGQVPSCTYRLANPNAAIPFPETVSIRYNDIRTVFICLPKCISPSASRVAASQISRP